VCGMHILTEKKTKKYDTNSNLTTGKE